MNYKIKSPSMEIVGNYSLVIDLAMKEGYIFDTFMENIMTAKMYLTGLGYEITIT
jgi:hypothetical protein